MSKYLYPYIREILKSKEYVEENSDIWNDFNEKKSGIKKIYREA